MKYLRQFSIILLISLIGEVLHNLIPLPVPASIYGLAILFTALAGGILSLDKVKETGYFLIEVMPLMFIPAAVGLIDSWHSIASAWLQYIVVTVVSTFVVMAVSGWFTQFVIKRGKEAKK